MTEVFASGKEYFSPNQADKMQRLASNVTHFGLMEDQPAAFDSLNLMEEIQLASPEVEIRTEQVECLDAIQLARLSGNERALVQMATGLGKTTVVAADVKRFLSENPSKRVLFLCHQNDILAQAKQRFEQIIGDEYSYGNFTGEEHNYHAVSCLFASFQTMNNWREAFNRDEFDYIVVDESHHGKAVTYEPTLNYFQPEFLLGMTATPDRHDLLNIREIFGEEIFRLSLEEAIARDLLTTVDYHVITDDIADATVLYDTDGRKFSIKQLDRTIFAPKRNEEIVRIINEYGDTISNAKRIIFCKSIEQTEEFARYFDRAAPLHSSLTSGEQDNYIQMFRNGDIDTLLTVDMFNEGIDIPDANQIVFLRSTQSKTVFLHQLGRGLRKAPGKEFVQVLDFVANCDRLAILDEVWKEVERYLSKNGTRQTPDTLRIDIGEVHFSEAARDILELLSEIESNQLALAERYTKPPEGWLSTNTFAKWCNSTNNEILRQMTNFGFEPAQFLFRNRPITFISPEAQEVLIDNLKSLAPWAPEGYKHMSAMSKELGVTQRPLKRLIAKYEIPASYFKYAGAATLGLSFSPEAQDQIRALPEFQTLPAPKGYISVTSLARSLGLDIGSMKSLVSRSEVPTEIHRYKGHAGIGLSPEAQQLVLNLPDLQIKAPPEGILSVAAFARQLDVSFKKLTDFIDEHNIPTQIHRFSGKPGKSLSPEVQTRLRRMFADMTPTDAPQGYMSASALATELGINHKTIIKYIKRYNIPSTKHQYHAKYGVSLSPEAQMAIRALPELQVEPPPPGYLSIPRFADEIGISAITLKKYVESWGIETVIHRYANNPVVSLSPEAQTIFKQKLSDRRQHTRHNLGRQR